MKKLITVTTLSLMSSLTYAQDWYAGAQYTTIEAELTDTSTKVESEPAALSFIGGYEINENLAIEGLAGFGTASDKIGHFDSDLELKNIFGISGVGILPITEALNFYGKAGIAQVNYEASEDGETNKADGTGLLLGIGSSYSFTDNVAVTVDYSVYPEAEPDLDNATKVKSNTLSFGVKMKF